MNSSVDTLKQNLELLQFETAITNECIRYLDEEVEINISGMVTASSEVFYNNIEDETLSDFDVQLKNGTDRLYSPQVSSDYSKSPYQVMADVLDEDQPVVALNILPEALEAHESDIEKTCTNLHLIGIDYLLPIANNISDLLIGVDNLIVVESRIKNMSIFLSLFKISELIEQCKSRGIGLTIIFDTSVDGLQARICQYLFGQNVPALYSQKIIRSRQLSAELTEYYSWLHAPTGLYELVSCSFGNETDELNQLMHTLWNITAKQSITLLDKDSNLKYQQESSAILVASGPSIDSSITILKEVCDSDNPPTVFAAGSAIGVLLRNGVNVEYLVLLEMGQNVFNDLSELLYEGYNLKAITLFCSTTVDPRVPTLFDNVVYFSRSMSASCLLDNNLNQANLLHSGPQAANAGIDVICSLGFKSIFLLGCDFSSTKKNLERSPLAIGSPGRSLDLPLASTSGKTVFADSGLANSAYFFDLSCQYYDVRPKVCAPTILKNVESISQEEFVEDILENQSNKSDLQLSDYTYKMSYDTRSDFIGNLRSASSSYFQGLADCIRSHQVWTHKMSLELSHFLNAFMISPVLNIDNNFDEDGSKQSALIIQRIFRYPLFLAIRSIYCQDKTTYFNGVSLLEGNINFIKSLLDIYFDELDYMMARNKDSVWRTESLQRRILLKEQTKRS